MKNKTSLRGLALISLTTLLLLDLSAGILPAENRAAAPQAAVPTIERPIKGHNEAAADNYALLAASAKEYPATILPAAPLCPTPTVKVGNQCVLTADVTLDRTLILPSDTTLNCQGHTLKGKVTPNPIDNSQPQVGIFLNNVRNVLIERCVIDNFDFGIFAINSKQPPQSLFQSFVIVDNIINARYAGVSLNSVDDAEIINNTISYTRAGGRALYIGRNSDSNGVAKNTLVANLAVGDSARAFRVPGPESPVWNPVLPPVNQPAGSPPGAVVVITQIEGPEPTLLNAIIDRKLFQLTTTNSLTPNRDFSENNRFEGNTIRFTGVPVDGVALAVPQGTHIINNTIEGGGEAGIRVGKQNLINRSFPGTCTLMPSRLCLDETGCAISGFDLIISRGPCTPRTTRNVSWISRATRIEENVITGPLGSGINTTGQNTTITGNTIVGPFRNAVTGTGIKLVGKQAIQTTTVTRNSVSNVAVALGLVQSFQDPIPLSSSFGSQVSLNDFTGYTTAVLTSFTTAPPNPNYHLPSELSVNGRGNFWLSLSEIVTCQGLNPADVKRSDGARDHFVIDSHPYGIPISKRLLLPNPCPLVSSP